MRGVITTLLCVALMPMMTIGNKLQHITESKIDNAWHDAHATFYGDIQGGDTMQGACGYGDLFKQGYGLDTAALSTALFNNGLTCGACFEIYCTNDPQWCKPNAGSIKITATNFCPPDYSKTHDIWCNPPQQHFDLSLKAFLQIANYRAGIVPVKYRRILCGKQGGVKFELRGSIPSFVLVLLYNVGGAGDVINVQIRGSKTNWIPLKRNWGQNWQVTTDLHGQSLSFQVTTSDQKTLRFDNVAPANWQLGQVFDGKINF